MAMKVKLPVGIENFEEIRTAGFYYVDKTGLIRDLLENYGKVNLFTRPRRFGKTLNMSMLKYFFEYGHDRGLFNGLDISGEKELCDRYMGNFPVISISLKGVGGKSIGAARRWLCSIIGNEALRFSFLAESVNLSETERQQYKKLFALSGDGNFAIPDGGLEESLFRLSWLVQKHYGKKVIMLIDEYDVPLDKAYQAGYYDEMVDLIRSMFSQALKTNDSLQFAVLTGCLQIAKESIFTGLNNFNVMSVRDVHFNEYFGFTDREVREMLAYYDRTEKYAVIKEWYDGYQFGNLEIYCPWDVISYCYALKMNPSAPPQNYWVNTSSNDIIRRFVSKAKGSARNEIEVLIAGGSISKEIWQELTYQDLDSDVENLWGILYTTGYLTRHGEDADGRTSLVIPNKEIRMIFIRQIQEWFKEETVRDGEKLKRFCKAFEENDTTAIEEGFTSFLKKTISIRDTSVKRERKENFYHGILLGLLGNMDDWSVMSNAEAGDGYTDIAIEIEEKETGIVIELKYAENADFETACRKALQQIRDRNYEDLLIRDGMRTIYRYGIACYKKRCKVISG